MSEVKKTTEGREDLEFKKTMQYLVIHLGLIAALGFGLSELNSRIANNKMMQSALNNHSQVATQTVDILSGIDSKEAPLKIDQSIAQSLNSKQNDLLNFLIRNQDLSSKLFLLSFVLLGPHVVYALSRTNQITPSAEKAIKP